MDFKINFFTCCNDLYSHFAPFFALSVLFHNENSIVEIGFESQNSINSIKNEINLINTLYDNKFRTKIVNFNFVELQGKQYPLSPNVVRFINTPSIKAEYVYISDIDIICLEKNICDIHIQNICKNNLKFSNMVRDKDAKYKKLTGLHFTPWDNYYPIKNFNNLILEGLLYHKNNMPLDEIFLYRLIKERGLDINENIKFRPVHGIHASPNRLPNGEKINWGMKIWHQNWLNFRNSEQFIKLEKISAPKIKEIILIIDSFYKNI